MSDRIPIEIINKILMYRPVHPNIHMIKEHFINQFAEEIIENTINTESVYDIPSKYSKEDLEYLYKVVDKLCWYPYNLMISNDETSIYFDDISRHF